MSEPVHTSETPAPEQAAQPEDGAKPDESQDSTDWKAEARKWEQRAKENQKAAKALEDQRKATMTEAERMAVEAEERGRMAERSTWGARLARTQYEAEAARRNPGYDVASVLDDLNLAKFIGEDGEPDVKAIAASVARLVPEASAGTALPPSFDGGTRQAPPSGVSMTQLIRQATGRA